MTEVQQNDDINVELKKEIKRLRNQAGMTQKEVADELNIDKGTFASYEQGRRTPSYKTMDKIRRVLGGDRVLTSDTVSSSHARRVAIQHAGAGPGQAVDGEEEIILDDRLFEGSGISFDEHVFVRVQGSDLEPILSHRQLVVVEPTDEVHGQDVYVYWRGDEEGYVVAIIHSIPKGLEIVKRGPDPYRVRWEHKKGDIYESENGGETRIVIFGRVLGAFGRTARQIADQNDAARHGKYAMEA